MDRDGTARKLRLAVKCTICDEMYYPGNADDKDRPRDKDGKLIRISMAEIKGFCSMKCQRSATK